MVNYIRHLNALSEFFRTNTEATPSHIALYYSLFQTWNNLQFASRFGINRYELMNRSKIGSNSTYSKCMRDLHRWGLINYQASNSKYGLSNVMMTPLDNKNNSSTVYTTSSNNGTSSDTSSDTSSGTSSDTSSDTSSGQEVVHILKHNKQINNNQDIKEKNPSIQKNKFHEPL